jgi:hypothetical protein
MEDPIRTLISMAIKRSGKEWATVAQELKEKVGARKLTEQMLHEYTRSRRSDNGTKKLFPMDWVRALVEITGIHELEQYALCEDCRRALAVGKIGMAAMSQKLR